MVNLGLTTSLASGMPITSAKSITTCESAAFVDIAPQFNRCNSSLVSVEVTYVLLRGCRTKLNITFRRLLDLEAGTFVLSVKVTELGLLFLSRDGSITHSRADCC